MQVGMQGQQPAPQLTADRVTDGHQQHEQIIAEFQYDYDNLPSEKKC